MPEVKFSFSRKSVRDRKATTDVKPKVPMAVGLCGGAEMALGAEVSRVPLGRGRVVLVIRRRRRSC